LTKKIIKSYTDRNERGEYTMQTLAWLAQEAPWVMAPAALISATAAIGIIVAVIRSRNIASKAMAVGVMVALTIGVMLWEGVP
jgi:hypothetical protein